MARPKKAPPPDPKQTTIKALFARPPPPKQPIAQVSTASPQASTSSSSNSQPLSAAAKDVKQVLKAVSRAVTAAVDKGKEKVIEAAKKVSRESAESAAPAPKPITTRGWQSKPKIVEALNNCKSDDDIIALFVHIHESNPQASKYFPPEEDIQLKTIQEAGGCAFAHKLRQPDDPSPTRVPGDPTEREKLFKQLLEAAIGDTSDRINHPDHDEGIEPALHALLGHPRARAVFLAASYEILGAVGPEAAHATRGVLLALAFGEAPAVADFNEVIVVPKTGKSSGTYGALGSPHHSIGHALGSYVGISTAKGNTNIGGLVWRIWQNHMGGQRLNSNDTYFYQVAFDPTKQNKQDKDFNGDFKPFVIGYIPVDLDLPSSFLNLVLTGLEAGLIRMSFSPSFKLLEGAEGALPARVKNWEKHKGTLDEYKINKRNETVHPLNRNPGGEARADTTGTRDYSEQVRVAAAAEGMETSKKRGQDRAAALKDYNTGMDFEEKSKIVTEGQANARAKDANLTLGSILKDFENGSRILRATRTKGARKTMLRLYNPLKITLLDTNSTVFAQGKAYSICINFEDEDEPLESWALTATPMKPREGLDSDAANGDGGKKQRNPDKRDLEREAKRVKEGKEPGKRTADGKYASAKQTKNADLVVDKDEAVITVRAADERTHRAFDSVTPIEQIVEMIIKRRQEMQEFDVEYQRKRAQRERRKGYRRAGASVGDSIRQDETEGDPDSEGEPSTEEEDDDLSASNISAAAPPPGAFSRIQRDKVKPGSGTRDFLASTQPSTSSDWNYPPASTSSLPPFSAGSSALAFAGPSTAAGWSAYGAVGTSSRSFGFEPQNDDDDVSMRSTSASLRRPSSKLSRTLYEDEKDDDPVLLEGKRRGIKDADDMSMMSDSSIGGFSFDSRRSVDSKGSAMSVVEMLDRLTTSGTGKRKGTGWSTSEAFYSS